MSIFHAYDIRGTTGTDLDPGIAYLIGRAVAAHLRARTVLVGRDMRASGVALEEALVRGLADQGADVVRIGLCSTSLFYHATQSYPAGVMVTASHNPAQYNGFKICVDGARPVGEASGLLEIERLVLSQEFPAPAKSGVVKDDPDALARFLDFIVPFLRTDRQFRIVVDAGNGMGGYTYGALRERLRTVEMIPLYFELDGTFPNHEANPLKPETLAALKARVIAERADLGVALDGDEDRIVFVDERGDDIPSDLMTAVIARQVLREHPGAAILYDVRQSRVTPEEIAAAGGEPVMTRVGHAFIKLAMRERHAAFGGELSGHYYNPEVQGAECTPLVLFRLLNLLAESGKALSAIVAPLRARYAKAPETSYAVPDPQVAVAALDEAYAAVPGAQTSRIDGVRVDFPEWWFNVRASNTEPLLRLNIEALTADELDRCRREIEERIRALGGAR